MIAITLHLPMMITTYITLKNSKKTLVLKNMLESQHILLAYSNICHDFSTFLGVIVIAIRDT